MPFFWRCWEVDLSSQIDTSINGSHQLSSSSSSLWICFFCTLLSLDSSFQHKRVFSEGKYDQARGRDLCSILPLSFRVWPNADPYGVPLFLLLQRSTWITTIIYFINLKQIFLFFEITFVFRKQRPKLLFWIVCLA